MKNVKWLTVIVILQAMILVGQWLGTPSVTSTARAQIPDSGAQQQEIISQLKTLNDRMDKLTSFLASGKLEVKVTQADDNKAGRR